MAGFWGPCSEQYDSCVASTSRISLKRIAAAPTAIHSVFRETPQYRCEPLDEALGVRLVLKVESVNPIRCFKGRGAELVVAALEENERVVCASAGNFGQAMAWSCRARGLPITVFAAETASPIKLERMRAMDAEVVLFGADFDAAKLEARRFAQAEGARFVEDSVDIGTVEGAGTIALELSAWQEPLDAVLVALGNGALFNGVATVLKDRLPETKRVVVQSRGAPAMVESWRSGERVVHEEIDTIADGIGVRIPVEQALEDMSDLVDEAVLVDDATILEAMRLVHRHAGLVVEPSAAVGVAALLENRERYRGQTVATILCGGNLTDSQVREWLLSGG